MAEKYELAYADYKAGMKYKDIAEKYGVSINTVKSWKSRKWGATETEKSVQPCVQPTDATETEISWVDIETEYVTDMRKKPCTLKGLAEKYDVSYQRIRDYSAENDWAGKRKKHQTITKQKTAEKIAELTSDDAAQATARHFEASNKLLDILEDAISTPGEFNKVVEKLRVDENYDVVRVVEIEALAEKRLATVVNTLSNIQKMQRETLDIQREKERVAIERERIAIAKESGVEDEYEDDGFMDALKGVKVDWSDD